MTTTEHAPKVHAKTHAGLYLARNILGMLAGAGIGLALGAGFIEVSVLAHWPHFVPFIVAGLVGLWVVSATFDVVVRRRRRSR